MTSDSTGKERPPGPRWPLPAILRAKAMRVRYPQPRSFVIGPRVVETASVVEVDVLADGDFPARALAPVLHVGDRVLTEFERLGEGHYKYFDVEAEELPEGAPVWWAWGGSGDVSGPRLEVEHPAPEPRPSGKSARRKSGS